MGLLLNPIFIPIQKILIESGVVLDKYAIREMGEVRENHKILYKEFILNYSERLFQISLKTYHPNFKS